ncbi:MAG: pimeloyl-ACP methyl ester carboxylesterase [Marivirga sp.]|jgi:pimeloyl-ACP methyl ester carboxylesterase
MLKVIKWVVISLMLLMITAVIVYYVGPITSAPNLTSRLKPIDSSLLTLEKYVKQKEDSAGEIKPDNEARIIWADSVGEKTDYAIVYLHGFGASQGEGAPVHNNIANRIGANLYLSRLSGHGLVRKDAFQGISAESYMESAAEALSIGKLLGDKVILIGTSTGASQALYLAANFPSQIAALVLYSPFIEMADQNLQFLSTGHWNEQIIDALIGSGISTTKRPDSVAAYWSTYYHADAYKALFSMVQYSTTPAIISKVNVPVFLAYYFKDSDKQDNVVSVEAMKELFISLPSKEKEQLAFPLTGNHVIASKWRSLDWQAVQDSTISYLSLTLNL